MSDSGKGILARPIIIIGSGRSGSSLLNSILGAHPDILMLGETRFAISHIWAALSQCDANLRLMGRAEEEQFARDTSGETSGQPGGEQQMTLHSVIEQREERRRLGVLVDALDHWFRVVESGKRAWGFKEIWNGAVDDYDWGLYDKLFPQAIWLHIVRHPVFEAQSNAALLGRELRGWLLEENLNAWLGIFKRSRERASTGRFFELRYEDLARDAAAALKPLLDQMGLKWDPLCQLASQRQYGAPTRKSPFPMRSAARVRAIPGLVEAMAELGYAPVDFKRPGDHPSARSGSLARRPKLESAGNHEWILVPPIFHESGNAWEVEFPATGDFDFEAHCDTVTASAVSPLHLFEDGKPLGPGHSPHVRIRVKGHGAYSHWKNRLIFSTSDNSDPNQNGRTYLLRVVEK